jgi:hypothetical protein
MPARLCTAKVDLRKQVEEAYREDIGAAILPQDGPCTAA